MEVIEKCVEDFSRNTVQDIFTDSVDVGIRNSQIIPMLSGGLSELTEGLILCSAACVNNQVLSVLNITCLVNVAPELPDLPLPSKNIFYHRIPIIDSGNSRIYSYFDQTADIIQKAISLGGKALVYCVAGVSRSASICIVYLMKHHNMTLLDAYNYVKMRRSKIKPNCGFFKQLIEYEKELFGDNTVKMVFNDMVQMEIPDVYDCEYQLVTQFAKKKRSQTGRY